MSHDVNETNGMPDDSASTVRAALNLVKDNALELLQGFDNPPSALRIQAGGVTLDAEWHQNAPSSKSVATQQSVVIAESADAAAPSESDNGLHELRAPAVGTFYRAPEPGARAFVESGDVVTKGSQVAIIEVMKLMIPVEADVTGKVVEVLKADGEPVEYDEPLFRFAPQQP
jgi:acetyl-CoA carboxylase biotin carboxyl carrier protein